MIIHDKNVFELSSSLAPWELAERDNWRPTLGASYRAPPTFHLG